MLTVLEASSEAPVLLRMLKATCSNHFASGGAESQIAQTNLYSVSYALQYLGLRVEVFGATSANVFGQGKLSGRWFLGRRGGRSVGGLAWFTEEKHVCPLRSSAVDALVQCVSESSGLAVAPWELFDAGAPKKKKVLKVKAGVKGKL